MVRAYSTQPLSASTPTRASGFVPTTATMAMASMMTGKASCTSATRMMTASLFAPPQLATSPTTTPTRAAMATALTARERDAAAVEDARKDVAAEIVRAKEVRGCSAEAPRRHQPPAEARLEGIVGGESGSEEA